jgi:hypothetical protein
MMRDDSHVRHRGERQCSHNRPIETINQAGAAVWDEPNCTGLAWLEADGRSRWNVQPAPESRFSIKGESRVGLGKMIMTTDLNRSVSCIRDSERDRCSIAVQSNFAGFWENFARYHVFQTP